VGLSVTSSVISGKGENPGCGERDRTRGTLEFKARRRAIRSTGPAGNVSGTEFEMRRVEPSRDGLGIRGFVEWTFGYSDTGGVGSIPLFGVGERTRTSTRL
jgi:hypothetical protein